MNVVFKATLTVAIAVLPVLGHSQDARNQGYLLDQNLNVVTSATTGICVRTSDWTPARAAAAAACEQCTPELCAKPKPAPAPAAVPATPAEKPKPPAPPAPKKEVAKPVPQKISFSADAFFDFDKAVLKPEGKAMLDELTRTLQGANYEVILAIGHADRIGSAAYNQKLSLRRAQAVKKYLTDKGIEPNRVYVDGKGKTQPVTKPGDCKGKRGKTLIACLQPDRRVDVEVTATKEAK
jgi:OOP family OmpA-OmpF porin